MPGDTPIRRPADGAAALPSVDATRRFVRPPPWMLGAVFIACVAYQFHTGVIHNDHFDRITRGWQILHLGAVPFRDFFDPGYLLTLYSSAFVQWVFGSNLIGELLLASVFMAAGFSLLFRLAAGVSRSVIVAAVVTLAVVATQPRLYDYDKVCFYAAGVALCWGYARRQCARSLIALAVGTVVAGLYRVDNGLYIAVGAAATIVSCHWPNMRLIASRSAAYAGAGLIAALPVLLLLLWHGLIGEAAGQVLTYARREGARTDVFRVSVAFSLPREEWPVSLAPIDRPHPWYWPPPLRVSSAWTSAGNAVAWMYCVLLLLPLLCLAILVWRAALARGSPADRVEVAGVTGTAVFTLIAAALILRDPVVARYGTVSVPAAVLAAWLASQCHAAGAGGPTDGVPARRAVRKILRVAGATLGGAAAAVTCISVGVLYRSEGRLNLHNGPRAAWSSAVAVVESLSATPPRADLLGSRAPLARYLRACTKPSDRLLLGWFAPDVPYFAGRGFGGGMLVYFGQHWSEPKRQSRILRRLLRESVPIVVLRNPAEFQNDYPLIYGDVQRRYDALGPVNVGADLFFFVLRNRPPTGQYPQGGTNLPCFGG